MQVLFRSAFSKWAGQSPHWLAIVLKVLHKSESNTAYTFGQPNKFFQTFAVEKAFYFMIL